MTTQLSRLQGNKAKRGITLVETLVGMAIAGVIIAQVCLLWFYSSRSFAAQMSYVDMDQASQRALDTLLREVRQVKSLTSYSTNKLIFKDYDDQTLAFSFSEGQLLRFKVVGGIMTRKVLLRDCKTGGFSIYQRTPIEGQFKYYPTDSPLTCKLVEVQWLCARKLFPAAPVTRESMHSAKIVIRAND